MPDLPLAEESYWQHSSPPSDYPALSNDLTVDVVVVGGGIAGLTAAWLLKDAGQKVAVLEKNTIGSGTTNKTTGKLTAQHNICYADLLNRLGDRTARTYAEANRTAVEAVRELIKKEKIDCDLEMADNYVFTTRPGKVNEFEAEAEAAARFGLPASFETESPLPFDIQGAVKFTGQAMLNAQKYVLGLARLVDGAGSYVFEHSQVTRFHDGRPAWVRAGAARVTARDIIVTTKVPPAPLVARGGYAFLEHPHTSYIVAGRPANRLTGMYISPDPDHYSILPVADGKRQLLLVGGANHIPGLRRPRGRYRKLARYAERYFGVRVIDYRWRGMDYMAYDGVPLVGKLYPWSKHLFVATGFKKWGLSTSMVAGQILRDSLLGKKNPWAAVYDSTRLKPVASIPHTIAEYLKG